MVDLKDTIRSFKAIMNGEGDDLPEGAFYSKSIQEYSTTVTNTYLLVVGDIDAARAKGEKILAELTSED